MAANRNKTAQLEELAKCPTGISGLDEVTPAGGCRREDLRSSWDLVRKLPVPIRKIIGDMSDTEKIIVGLDLRPKEK